MTDETETLPIEAHASPLPDQLWAAVRQVAPPIAAFALAKGWIDNEALALLTALAAVVWPIIAGQLKTRRRAVELATVAGSSRVPDSVAKLK
jgi:uncharacterized membrane protein